MRRQSARQLAYLGLGVIALGAAPPGLLGVATPSAQTIIYSRGQNVVPSFEGWERNPDGTFSLWFGYMNRNMDEKVHIPIGPHNKLEPGPMDAGQPTYFQPRRNRYVFRVTVPPDFGTKEVVWTLTAHGRTESAYGSLRADYVTDDLMKMMDIGGLGVTDIERNNRAPVVSIEGEPHRMVKRGEQLSLTAVASDDGIPKPKPAAKRTPVKDNAWGLRVAWLVYRGAGDQVTFDPKQLKTYPDYRGESPWTPGWAPPPLPADGRFPVTATFAAPGTYVLRVMAHDGGFISTDDVTVIVTRE
jgi:hypothetical protein